MTVSFGWLWDPSRQEFVQPASKEQLELFEKQGFVPHPLDWQCTKPRRLLVKQREPWERKRLNGPT